MGVTPSHLLDTDVCIEVLRRRDRALLRHLQDNPDVGISTVTLAELEYGARRSRDPEGDLRAVEVFAALAIVVPLDATAARSSGEARAALAAKGAPIGSYDVLVAGQALALDVPLVTRNGREFRRVPGLRVKRW